MTRPHAWLRALALLTCCGLAACGRNDAAAQTTTAKPYEQPPGWSSECFGRFVVDVPGRLEFGEAEKHFGRGNKATDRRYVRPDDQSSPFQGAVGIASTVFRESQRLSDKIDFRFVWRQAENTYLIDLIRDGGPPEARPDRRQVTQKHSLPNDAFIWRYKAQFDFGTLVESDMRARILHGELSGEGSLAQARAVVDALWPRYRTRNPGGIPATAGICTPYGFFADPPKLTERDYGLSFDFPDPRHSNLILHLGINTLGYSALGETIEPPRTPIEQWPTPWEKDAEQATRSKQECQTKAPTSTSRDIFGCMFAGARDIKAHRPVQYLTLQNGQRARLLAYELYSSWNDGYEYTVRLQVQGQPGSATQPNIELAVHGVGPQSQIAAMQGKKPPPIEEAIATVRTIGASLRLRPGAVAEGAQVKDTLEGVR